MLKNRTITYSNTRIKLHKSRVITFFLRNTKGFGSRQNPRIVLQNREVGGRISTLKKENDHKRRKQK